MAIEENSLICTVWNCQNIWYFLISSSNITILWKLRESVLLGLGLHGQTNKLGGLAIQVWTPISYVSNLLTIVQYPRILPFLCISISSITKISLSTTKTSILTKLLFATTKMASLSKISTLPLTQPPWSKSPMPSSKQPSFRPSLGAIYCLSRMARAGHLWDSFPTVSYDSSRKTSVDNQCLW